MLWHLEIQPAPGHPDLAGNRLSLEAAESGIPGPWTISASRGFLIEGTLSRDDLDRAARQVLVDPVVETFQLHPARSAGEAGHAVVHVLPKPGVTDPEAESALELLRDLGFAVDGVRTIRSLPGWRARRRLAPADPARAGQRRRRAGGPRALAVRPSGPGAAL